MEKQAQYEAPEILEIGAAEELTLGSIPGVQDDWNCDREDDGDILAM